LYKQSILALPVSISSISSFSPLGSTTEKVWESYLKNESCIKKTMFGTIEAPAAALDLSLQQQIRDLRATESKYTQLDDSVLYAILCSRKAVQSAGWKSGDLFGINIGSSRGATQLFEKHHSEFIKSGSTAVHASPSTTLGNISSWVSHDLKSKGPEISHSITCSTALHALLNGVAWLRSGMADKFLVGGSEASLTPFTLAQMKAMKIYSNLDGDYPSRTLDLDKKVNSMVLGEGAASACLEAGKSPYALAYIDGIGYATEVLQHGASLSADAACLQQSMRMALEHTDPATVDAVVMHAPGTIVGDRSEYAAIVKVFGKNTPLLTTNKWKIGHTFGSSGMLSLELAILMMVNDTFIPVPFFSYNKSSKPIKKVLVNAVGFGGNAVSVLISKP
jgi:3-oxoacyl-(acyl-carrier-protein) synthase